MKVGFIGFGEVASKLTRNLLNKRIHDNIIEVISSTEGRSEKTKKIAENSLATLRDSFEEVAMESDILISATVPYEAVSVAKKYGPLVNGIFLDLNNVSPKTTLEINSIFNNTNKYGSFYTSNYSNNNTYLNHQKINTNFIKGSIMGSINSTISPICVSGENASQLKILNDYGLNIRVISKNVVDATYIKMLRSIYTKGVTALLYEVFNISESMNMTKELFESLISTEGENFEKQTISRIDNLTKSHERKFQEMDEILEFLKMYDKDLGTDFTFVEATRNKFKDFQ